MENLDEQKLIILQKLDKLATRVMKQCEKIEKVILRAIPLVREKGLEK